MSVIEKRAWDLRFAGVRAQGTASFSQDMAHRYWLLRTWGGPLPDPYEFKGIFVGFIMLNPSTADEAVLDPTIRRCASFALALGAGGMEIANLFSYRATDPDWMKAQGPEAIGGDVNDLAIQEMARRCDVVICAWGTHGKHLGRDAQVKALLRPHRDKVWCLSLTKDGHPGHPLYLPKSATPIPFDLPA